MINEIDEQIKHKKKKPSTVSKSNEKSKHKHEYVDCLFIYDNRPLKGQYCKICGKINNINIFETEPLRDSGLSKMLTKEEVYEKYKDLEQIVISRISDKYIKLD